MAYVYKRGGKWYIGFRNNRGQWRAKACSAQNKTQAKKLADELGLNHERQRFGLEPLPASDGGGTFGALLRWWLRRTQRSRPRTIGTSPLSRSTSWVRRLRSCAAGGDAGGAGGVPGAEGRPARAADGEPPSPLRADSVQPRAAGGAMGGTESGGGSEGPARPKRKGDFLRADEVGPVLAATPPRWRPLMATAVYRGLRKGELLGLRKTDVDLAAGSSSSAGPYDRETTKGGRAEAIPVAAELMPYLRAAMKASPSDLVFPDLEGRMLSRHTPLEEVLRRALGHAGIVEGWQHVCRKPECGYAEPAADDQVRRCPRHGMKLWPKAQGPSDSLPRPPAHDRQLAHDGGVNPVPSSGSSVTATRASRRRPTDTCSRTTCAARSIACASAPRPRTTSPNAPNRSQPSAANSRKLLTTFLQGPRSAGSTPSEGVDFRQELSTLTSAGWTGLEPAASGVTGRRYNQA